MNSADFPLCNHGSSRNMLKAILEFEFVFDQTLLSLFKSFAIHESGNNQLCGFLCTKEVDSFTETHKLPNNSKRKFQIPKTVIKSSSSSAKISRALPISAPASKTSDPGNFAIPDVNLNQFREFTSEGEKLFFCNLCTYSSNVKSNMKKHINLKHNENCPKFQCSMCSLQSKLRGQLKSHYMNVHSLPENVAKSAANDSAQV